MKKAAGGPQFSGSGFNHTKYIRFPRKLQVNPASCFNVSFKAIPRAISGGEWHWKGATPGIVSKPPWGSTGYALSGQAKPGF